MAQQIIASREQADFIYAEGAYTVACAAVNREREALDDSDEDAYITAATESDERHGMVAKYAAYRAAEDALIAWGIAKVRREQGDHPVLELVPQIQRNLKARRKLVELCWTVDPR